MTVEANVDCKANVDRKANALAAAALLERWAEAVPMWSPQAGERWDAFANRRYDAESALEARLRNLPSCFLSLNSTGSEATLMLAGIRVTSHGGLAGACRSWAAELRRRASL